MAIKATTKAMPLPDHVPRELVRPWPYILGAKTTKNPFSYIADIHKGPEIFWAERAFAGVEGAWVPRLTVDIQSVFHDIEHYTVKGLTPWAELVGEDWHLIPMESDPPEHTALRSVLNPLFAPKRIVLMEDKIRMRARGHIQSFKGAGTCEFMKDFAFEFPIRVFLDLFGLHQDMVDQFFTWEHALIHESDLEKVKQATREITAYLGAQCDDRRVNPRDDLITHAVQMEIHGRKLTDNEIKGICFTLFSAGLDTVSTNLGLQFRHLAEHRDHQATLRSHPEKIPDAITELMRFYGPVFNSRRCSKETTLRGQTIKVGDKVILPTFLAGRDPSYYDNADQVILDRKPRHLGFGYGIHICLGMHLARLQLRIAMEEFLAAIPEFAIPPGAEIESYLGAIIEPIELPLVWNAK